MSDAKEPPPERKTSAKAAALAVALGISLSRLFGLVRERVLAHYLGNDPAAGAFRAALRIPNLLQNLFGEGALSASFIPVYVRLLARGETRAAAALAATVFSFLFGLTGLLVLVGMACAGALVDVLTPGFEGETRALTAGLVRVMFPGIGFLVLSAWCLGVLNSHRRFFLSYVAPVAWNAAIVGFLVVGAWNERAGQTPGDLVWVAAWGVTAGSFLQFLIQLPSALRSVGRAGLLRFRRRPEGEPFREVLSNFLPAFLARGVVQLSAYVDAVLTSYLGAAMVAATAYAQTLALLPVSLFAMSISAAELPEMARASLASSERHGAVRTRLAAASARMAFFVVPSTVALVLLGDQIVSLLFRTGRFGDDDVPVVWIILAGMSVALPLTTRARLYASSFWALGDTRTPAVTAFLRVVVGGLVGWVIVFPVRASMALTTAQSAALLALVGGVLGGIEGIVLQNRLARWIGPVASDRRLLSKIWTAALLSGVVCAVVSRALTAVPQPWRGIGVLVLFGGIYLVSALLLGIPAAKDCVRLRYGK